MITLRPTTTIIILLFVLITGFFVAVDAKLTFKVATAQKVNPIPGSQWFFVESELDIGIYNNIPGSLLVSITINGFVNPIVCSQLFISRHGVIHKLIAECPMSFVGTYDIKLGAQTASYIQEPVIKTFPLQLVPSTTVSFTAEVVKGIETILFSNGFNQFPIAPQADPNDAQKLLLTIPNNLPIGAYTYIFQGNTLNLFSPPKVFAINVIQPTVTSITVVDFVNQPTLKIDGLGFNMGVGILPGVVMNGKNCYLVGVQTDTSFTCQIDESIPNVYQVTVNLPFYPAPADIYQLNVDYRGSMSVYTRGVNQVPQFYFSGVLPVNMLPVVSSNIMIGTVAYVKLQVTIPANAAGQYDVMMKWVGVNIPDTKIPITYVDFEPIIFFLSPRLARFTPSFININSASAIVTPITIRGSNFINGVSPTIYLDGVDPITQNAIRYECENVLVVGGTITCDVKSAYETEFTVTVSYGEGLLSNGITLSFYGLSCLGRNNRLATNPPVDWWFTFKYKFSSKTPDNLKDNYLYVDNLYDRSVARYKGLTDTNAELSPLAATFDQIRYGYSYIFYNDQNGMRRPNDGVKVLVSDDPLAGHKIFSRGSDFGHTKGIVIYDHVTGSGIHITHSQPYWPAFTYNGLNPPTKYGNPGNPPYEYYDIRSQFWLGDATLNQHFFCYTFGPFDPNTPIFTGINYISAFIAQNYPMIYQVVNNAVKGTFQKLDDLLTTDNSITLQILKNCDNQIKAKGNLYQYCWWWSEFYTKGATKLDMFSKTTNEYKESNVPVMSANAVAFMIPNTNPTFITNGIDLSERMVEKFNQNAATKRPFFIQTLDLGGTRRQYQTLEYQKIMANVEYTLHDVDLAENVEDLTNRADSDHSKLVYNMYAQPYSPDRYDNIFCSGDLNRHNHQGERGGGYTCLNHPNLVNFFSNRVARYSNVIPIDSAANTFAVQSKGSYYFPPWMTWATMHMKILSGDATPVPAGLLFEIQQVFSIDKGQNYQTVSTYPRTYGVADTQSHFQVEMGIYRRAMSLHMEWDQTWSHNIMTDNPISVKQLYALEDNSYNVYSCDQVVAPCNRENAQRVETTLATNPYPFNYGFQYILMFSNYLQYTTPANNPMAFIGHYLEYVKTKYLLPDIVSIQLVPAQPNTLTTLQNGQLYIHNINCKDEVAFVITWYLIKEFIVDRSFGLSPLPQVDDAVIQGISWAISKTIINEMYGVQSSFVDQCFVSNPENNNNIIAYDLEGMPANNPPPSAFWYAATVWDWIDSNNDEKLCPQDPFTSAFFSDMNSNNMIKWQSILDKVEYAQTIQTLYASFDPTLQVPVNQNILYYNGEMFFDLMVQNKRRLTTTTTSTPIVNTYSYDNLIDLLVTPGYFTSYQIYSLNQQQVNNVTNAIQQWFTPTPYTNSSQAIQVLLEIPLNSLSSNNLLLYFDIIFQDQPTDKIRLCYLTNSTRKVCDPLTLVTLTDLIESLVDSSELLNGNDSNSDSDLQVYYSPKIIPGLSEQYSGILYATFRNRICDVQLVNYRSDDLYQFIDQMCNVTGPIINYISQTNGSTSGNYSIDIVGYHFSHGIEASIGDYQCLQTIYINSTFIKCVVPPSSGVDLSIQLYDPTTDNYDCQSYPFIFSYFEPIIESISPNLIPTTGSNITIYGENFGNLISNIIVNIDDVQQNITIIKVDHTIIICSIPAGTGTNFFLSVYMNGNKINSINGIQSLRFSYQPPTISTFSPSIGTPFGLLSVQGSGFGQNSSLVSVSIGTSSCPIVSISDTSISCSIPFGAGSSKQYVSVQVSNNIVPTVSSSYFSYSAPSIGSNSALIPTTGGLMQFRGSGFGSSFDDINSTKLDSISIDCYSFNVFMECPVPEGFQYSLDLTIVSGDNVNTTTIFAYQAPTIHSYQYKPSDNSITIGGTNFIPSTVTQDATCWIQFTNYQNQKTNYYNTFVNETTIVITNVNPIQNGYQSVQVVIGERPSNSLSTVVYSNLIITLFQDSNLDNIHQSNEMGVSGAVTLTSTTNPSRQFVYQIITGSLTVNIPEDIYSINIQPNSQYITPLNNYLLEIVSLTNHIDIPVWILSGKGCVGYYLTNDQTTTVTLQYGQVNLLNYGICYNSQNCLYPLSYIYSPTNCILTIDNDISLMEIGYQVSFSFYMDSNLNGQKEGFEMSPPPFSVFLYYTSSTDGITYNVGLETGSYSLFVKQGLLDIYLEIVQPNLYTIVNAKTYNVTQSFSDSFGLFNWVYSSIRPVILYSPTGTMLTLPVGKYDVNTLTKMGWNNTSITSLNGFTNSIGITFYSSESIDSVVLQTTSNTKIPITPVSNVLIEVAYLSMFSSLISLNQAGQSVEFFSPYLNTPLFYFGSPLFTNQLSCGVKLSDSSKIVCNIPPGSGAVQISMTSMYLKKYFPYPEYKYSYEPINVQGTVYEDLNGNNIKDIGEIGISGVVIKINGSTVTTSDANGNYYLPSIVSGSYSLTINTISTHFLPTTIYFKVGTATKLIDVGLLKFNWKGCNGIILSGAENKLTLQYGTFSLSSYGWCNSASNQSCTMKPLDARFDNCTVEYPTSDQVRIRYKYKIQLVLYVDSNLDNILNEPANLQLPNTIVTLTHTLKDGSLAYSAYSGAANYIVDVTMTNIISFNTGQVPNVLPVVNNFIHTVTSSNDALVFQYNCPFFQYVPGAPSQTFYDSLDRVTTGSTLTLPVGTFDQIYLRNLPVSWDGKIKTFTVNSDMSVAIYIPTPVLYQATRTVYPPPVISKIDIFSDFLLENNLVVPTMGGTFFINNWSFRIPQIRICSLITNCQLSGQKLVCPVLSGINQCTITISYTPTPMYQYYNMKRAPPTVTGFSKHPSHLPANELVINGYNFPPAGMAGNSTILVDGYFCQLLSFISDTKIACLSSFQYPPSEQGFIDFRFGNSLPFIYQFTYLSSKCMGAQIWNGTSGSKTYPINTNVIPPFAYTSFSCSWFCYCRSIPRQLNSNWNVGVNSGSYSQVQPFAKEDLQFIVRYASCNGAFIYLNATDKYVSYQSGDYSFSNANGITTYIKPQIGCKLTMQIDDGTSIVVLSSFDPRNFPDSPFRYKYLKRLVVSNYPDMRGDPLPPDGSVNSSPPLLGLGAGNYKIYTTNQINS
ncbi:hypothetical protein PPL_11593 [Heterostelium album PN500]|uniref:IPT/TIG domain-containing protein n=1 Tax=Heterostelium pallidum (strain ATCC 26659 / Pp 5 / PN500) TaxID=670386 RepID=D3BV68_HETP5|nr:hypothetical protein PPL_11593 [Heterostelium album PN500]EFA74625.1 hypothetical protein PPL_11593 [Heterostelium album PN500]|eukprot:XP_020426759.1 hypothetical protein PPL_11593 [Heterostelium album PN500]